MAGTMLKYDRREIHIKKRLIYLLHTSLLHVFGIPSLKSTFISRCKETILSESQGTPVTHVAAFRIN